MGRYYNGDIEGKFWFAVQDSNDADFFGVSGEKPAELEYYFITEDLPKIEGGIAKCREALGDNYEKMANFFAKNSMYNNEMVEKETGIKIEDIPPLLQWYARLTLGLKIYNCVKENGECSFTAEL